MNKKLVFIALIAATCLSSASLALSYDSSVSDKPSQSATGDHTADTVISTAVVTKFNSDDELKSLNIGVDTNNASVVLSGNVPSEYLKQRAISAAKGINGVKEVVSKLQVI